MKKFIFILCAILVLLFCIPIPFYKGKKVHISIDDVYECMKTVARDSIKYESIFEHPFFSSLKSIHKKTGAKFTLYTYENGYEYNISNFPNKYEPELKDSKDWLQFGFHATAPEISKDYIANFITFTKSYKVFQDNINKLGGGASTLRLHFYFATPEEIEFLSLKGITTFLTSDDDRVSYSLPDSLNKKLLNEEILIDNNSLYIKTDIRSENSILPFFDIYKNLNDEILVLFTHEWALNSRYNRMKFHFFIYLLYLYNSEFII